MIQTDDLNPQERLAITRAALVKQMAQGGRHEDGYPYDDSDVLGRNSTSASAGGGAWKVVKRALQAWWEHNPAHLVVDLARPVLARYAVKKPLQLLGLSAGIGAAAVLVRPWRLVSLTGLALAALKSSRVSSVVLSLITANANPKYKSANTLNSPNTSLKDYP